MSPSRDERLAKYREKRRAGRTPEPFGGEVVVGGSSFVVQKHHARALHWDLRLELDGVLLSWAVPKGPSPNQADKRLAMQTEDHPLEYAEFEGVIPEGEYGAGSMIVWDRGTWSPVEDPRAGLEKGKLLFDLHGHKLLGRWTLVKTKQAPNSWLLIKERDGFMDAEGGTESYPDDSIYSGLTVDEFPHADEHAERLAERAAALGAKRRTLRADDVDLMLATSQEEPFTREGWIFELKYDGYRLLAERKGREPYLRSRAGHDLTLTFPEIARAVHGLPLEGLVLDGEVVVHDADGLPSFSRLQRRGRILNRMDALRASVELPAIYYAFDLLALEGFDLRGVPLLERKALLRELLPSVGPIRYSDHIAEQGEAMFEQVTQMRLEGIVGKKADSAYSGGRSPHWIKVRTVRVEDFVVVGWTKPKGSRSGFGSLHIAQYDGDDLLYLGSVGSGFTEADLADTMPKLEALEIDACACTAGPVPKGKGNHWVAPRLVVEVKYKELTDQGLARQPSFSRFREDKPPEECVVEGAAAPEAEPETTRPGARGARAHGGLLEPRQGVLAGGGLHQGRPHRVPPCGRRVDAPLPRGPAARDDALPGRHPRKVVLPEGRAALRARVDPAGDAVERGLGARAVVLRGRRPRVAAVRDQPGHDPAAHLVEQGVVAREPGLVHPGPGSEGGALRARRGSRAHAARRLRGDRAALLRQDERLLGDPRAGAARGQAHVRAVAHARPAPRAGGRGRAHRDRHAHAQPREARGKGLCGLRAERAREAAGRALHRAAPPRRHGLRAPRVVGGHEDG